MQSVDQIRFPVVLFTRDYIVGSIESAKQLTTVGQMQFEGGCFENAVIADSAGNKYLIRDAQVRRLTLNPWNVFRKYRAVIVNLTLSDPERIHLDQLRNEIVDLILEHPKWHRSYGETESDVREKFSGQDSAADLIRAVSVYP